MGIMLLLDWDGLREFAEHSFRTLTRSIGRWPNVGVHFADDQEIPLRPDQFLRSLECVELEALDINKQHVRRNSSPAIYSSMLMVSTWTGWVWVAIRWFGAPRRLIPLAPAAYRVAVPDSAPTAWGATTTRSDRWFIAMCRDSTSRAPGLGSNAIILPRGAFHAANWITYTPTFAPTSKHVIPDWTRLLRNPATSGS
jgi:hypothetical protein